MALMTEQTKQSPERIRDMLLASAATFADKPAILAKTQDGYRAYTYRRLRSDIEALGACLATKGLVGKKILLMGDNGYEWTLALLTALSFGIVAFPVDKAIAPEELLSLCEYTGAAALLYADGLTSTASSLPASVEKLAFSSFDALLEQGRQRIDSGTADLLRTKTDADAPALLLLTSSGGQTAPRIVTLSNTNLCFAVTRAQSALGVTSSDSFLSLLPLSHAYALVCDLLVPLTIGASLAFGEGLHAVLKNMGELHPTVLVTVPVIAEALYKKVQKILTTGYGKHADASVAAVNFLPNRLAMPLKKRIFDKIHHVFGDSLRTILCVGAPVGSHIMKGLHDVGFVALEGYGLCEGTALLSINPKGAVRYGSTGKALPDSVIDIYNVGEDGTGEIRVKSDGVMLGYFENEAASAEVLRGGWLYTGDLGYLDGEGYLYVTGRKKNLLVSRLGKNIFPEELEALLVKEKFVREAVVVGFVNEQKRDYDLVAVIYPDREKLAESYGDGYSVRDAETEIEHAIEAVNATLPEYKRLTMFILRSREFEKNSSRKIRRAGVAASVLAEYEQKKQRQN